MAYLKNCINITLTSILLNLTLGAMERERNYCFMTRPLKSKKKHPPSATLKSSICIGQKILWKDVSQAFIICFCQSKVHREDGHHHYPQLMYLTWNCAEKRSNILPKKSLSNTSFQIYHWLKMSLFFANKRLNRIIQLGLYSLLKAH